MKTGLKNKEEKVHFRVSVIWDNDPLEDENKLYKERRTMQIPPWLLLGDMGLPLLWFHTVLPQLFLLKGGLFCVQLDLKTTSTPVSCPQSSSSCSHCIKNFLGTYSTTIKSRTQPRVILPGFRASYSAVPRPLSHFTPGALPELPALWRAIFLNSISYFQLIRACST